MNVSGAWSTFLDLWFWFLGHYSWEKHNGGFRTMNIPTLKQHIRRLKLESWCMPLKIKGMSLNHLPIPRHIQKIIRFPVLLLDFYLQLTSDGVGFCSEESWFIWSFWAKVCCKQSEVRTQQLLSHFLSFKQRHTAIYSLPVRPLSSFQPTEEQLLLCFVLICSPYFGCGITCEFEGSKIAGFEWAVPILLKFLLLILLTTEALKHLAAKADQPF